MNLDLFNNLINTVKESNIVENFINELSKGLENNTSDGKILDKQKNNVSLLDELYKQEKITAEYRDKMYIERNNILSDYSDQTSNEGEMYYIYGIGKDNNYLLSVCDKERSHEVIKINENDLPEEASVNSVLRLKNGEYFLDKTATQKVQEKMQEKFNELLKEQEIQMQAKRIDGHLYEFVESSGNRVWLIDKNTTENNTNTAYDVFEELKFPKNLLNSAKQGDVFEYVNGEYKPYSN